MKDNFDVHEWRIDQIRKENLNEQLDDEKAVQSIAAAVADFADVKNDKFLQGVIRTALGSAYLNEDLDYLGKLSSKLSKENPELTFDVNELADRIDVRKGKGTARDLENFGEKNHGKVFGEYEVFHIDDSDRGDIVRIVKSSVILRGK